MSQPDQLDHCGSVAPTRWLVLGGAGFVGRQVVATLARYGHRVWTSVRPGQQHAFVGRDRVDDQVLEADLADEGALSTVFSEVRPDITLNCVGYGIQRGQCDEQLAERMNGWLPPRLIEIIGARAVGVSPVVVHLASEFERRAPLSLYGRTKAQGTVQFVAACRTGNVRGVVARIFTLYGPYEQPGRLLPSLCELTRREGELNLTAGAQVRDFTYVEDVAAGIIRLAESRFASGEIIDLGTGRNTSVRDFSLAAAQELGIDPTRLRFGALPQRDEDLIEVAPRPADVTRLRELTGWQPTTTIRDGVRQTARQLGDLVLRLENSR
ncbi:MAG: NAD-dependent epimerase/dehydratase family protein [Pirellulales bacterium]